MAIQISLELSHQCPLEEITDHAKFMDNHEFYRVWVPDTLVSNWDAWLAASIILHNTRKIHIGLGVTNPYTRHPIVMAQMAATFQNASNGRFAIALGKGIKRFLEKAGIAEKPSSVEECARLLKELIAGERVTFKGDAFDIEGIRLRTRPPKQNVPILLAATHPKTWDAAIAVADGITTFWSGQAGELSHRFKNKKAIHTAAMIPFSQSKDSFMTNTITSLDILKQEITKMERAGFDEAIIAYGDLMDLEDLATLF